MSKSKTNSALVSAARRVPGVEILDIQALYPEGRIDTFVDAAIEAERLLSADRIVLQFPVQWYSVPSLMKNWIDAVFTRMYYIATRPKAAGSKARRS